ncbi:terminus macrodomain insulation protein YfbV [Candidatus Colwellia aromaticivorans]|uniref:terminus macrodomain insulation protein YfbV n=1 Tax=Candidatus Colwellia aromaticivorans TaxID=2267621 RepID=UPI000DF29D28|nr:terminus macrodomain insulation protein YfbV [Candidatus Colwellia aromaticivorans]
MNLSVIQIIKLGQQYIGFWPEKAELSRYFADYRAVQSARFVCRYFPALALFIFIMQLYFSSGFFLGSGSIANVVNALPQALVYGLFFLSIPVQALVFLGVKADKFLPPSLASWYRSGLEKAKEQGSQNKLTDLAIAKPRYIDLAKLLQLTFASNNN